VLAAFVLCGLVGASWAKEPGRGAVKVFLLVGQSNMEGKAKAGTLEPAIADPKMRDRFKHLKKNGEWTVREDVWVTFLCRRVKGPYEKKPPCGPLTVGFGGFKTDRNDQFKKVPVPTIGPELGFGHVLGNHFDEQVLLIKAAWGGISLKKGFLPPSAGGPGPKYTETVAEVRKVLDNLKKYFPGYDEKQGYEIVGLVWFQGWNDGVGQGNPDYTEQLAHFIRDIRREFNVSDMPVVIGELGTDGPDAAGWVAEFRKRQAAVADIPQFKENVRFARTAQFWPTFPAELNPKWEEFKKKNKAFLEQAKKQGKKLTPKEIWEFGNKHWRIYKDVARMSDKRYHYWGSGECYYLMGEAFGKAMLEMLK